MELSPQSVASTTFKTVKKGYDPDEVRAYLAKLATAIESTQAQASAMEARARAAVARLQERTANTTPAGQAAPAPVSFPSAGVDEAGTISRTLLLAQRTADTTIAEAEADAKRIREQADAEARFAVDSASEMQNRLIEEAKGEARRAAEGARIQVEGEVQALLARREFLLSDVEHLEQHVITHRDRLREVAGALTAIVEHGPGGLADVRRPLMSAVTDGDSSAEPSTDAAPVDATRPMSRLDWLPEETPDQAATDGASDDEVETGGDAVVDAPAEATKSAAQPPVDVTPLAGVLGLTNEVTDEVTAEVTAEVPIVSRPANNAFRGRGDDRR